MRIKGCIATATLRCLVGGNQRKVRELRGVFVVDWETGWMPWRGNSMIRRPGRGMELPQLSVRPTAALHRFHFPVEHHPCHPLLTPRQLRVALHVNSSAACQLELQPDNQGRLTARPSATAPDPRFHPHLLRLRNQQENQYGCGPASLLDHLGFLELESSIAKCRPSPSPNPSPTAQRTSTTYKQDGMPTWRRSKLLIIQLTTPFYSPPPSQ